jgi:hypothetical protein
MTTWKSLTENLASLQQVQDADLVFASGIRNDGWSFKIWRSRMGLADGAPFPEGHLEIEVFDGSKWRIEGTIDVRDGSDSGLPDGLKSKISSALVSMDMNRSSHTIRGT